MEPNFSLDILNEDVEEDFFESEEWNEFCYLTRTLDDLYDETIYVEAMNDPRKNVIQKVKGVAKNTKETTKAMGGAYGDITTGVGGVMKSAFDAAMVGIKLAFKSLNLIFKGVSVFPNTIVRTSKLIGQLNENIRRKITGDLTLYITLEDLDKIYNTSLLVYLKNLISTGNSIIEGTTWDVHKKCVNFILGKSDPEKCKKVIAEFSKVSAIHFDPTKINMNDPSNVERYFGAAQNVNFRELLSKDRSMHRSNYYEALFLLSDDLKNIQEQLQVTSKLFNEKIFNSKIESVTNDAKHGKGFHDISDKNQNIILKAAECTAKAIDIVGQIIKYINMDMAALKDCVHAIAKKYPNLNIVDVNGNLIAKQEVSQDTTKEQKQQQAAEAAAKKAKQARIGTASK